MGNFIRFVAALAMTACAVYSWTVLFDSIVKSGALGVGGALGFMAASLIYFLAFGLVLDRAVMRIETPPRTGAGRVRKSMAVYR